MLQPLLCNKYTLILNRSLESIHRADSRLWFSLSTADPRDFCRRGAPHAQSQRQSSERGPAPSHPTMAEPPLARGPPSRSCTLGETAQNTVTVVHSAMVLNPLIPMLFQGWQSNALSESYTLVQMDSSFDPYLPNKKNRSSIRCWRPIQYLRGMYKARTATVSVMTSRGFLSGSTYSRFHYVSVVGEC